jgi:hypothetical protein
MNQTIILDDRRRNGLPVSTFAPASGGAPRQPRARAMWMAWTPGSVSNTTAAETAFVRDLVAICHERRIEARRGDVTAVLNAIRCGVTVQELFEQAPGLVAERLYDAYLNIDERRRRSLDAWEAITVTPTAAQLAISAPEAGKLFPSFISQLQRVVVEAPGRLESVIHEMIDSSIATSVKARGIEHELAEVSPSSARGDELMRRFYDPTGDGITSRPDHVPHRVGTLVPTRVAALLGERHVSITIDR